MANKNIIRLIDSNTGESVNYEEVTTWHDGTDMDDSKVDNVVYRKGGGKYWKMCMSGAVSVRRFGAKCDGITDDTDALNLALSVYDEILIEGALCVSSSIEIQADKAITGINGGYIKPLVQINPVIKIHAGGTIKDLDIRTTGILMGNSDVILINASTFPLNDFKYAKISNVNIFAELDTMLQGQGLALRTKLQANAPAGTYSLIQFANVDRLTVSGLRDGIVLENNYNNNADGRICYINGNSFSNIKIINCLRSVLMKNINCTASQSTSGMSQIDNNRIIGTTQHLVENYACVTLEKATNNIFDLQIFDWIGNHYEMDEYSTGNQVVNMSTKKNKIQRPEITFVSSEQFLKAKALIDGAGTVIDAYNIRNVTKVATGAYDIQFQIPTLNNYPVILAEVKDTDKKAFVNVFDQYQFNLQVVNTSGINEDPSLISIIVF